MNKLLYHATAALPTVRGANVGMDGNTVRLRAWWLEQTVVSLSHGELGSSLWV